MAAVLFAALGLYLKISYDRQPIYRKTARDYAAREEYAIIAARDYPKPSKLHHWVNTENGSWEISPDHVDYYRLMHQKYERLARYPWLPAAADPSEPPIDRTK
jgi:hypothetical protein